jgi:GTP cyclohydrolase I
MANYTLKRIIVDLLNELDPDPDRPGLADTPDRVARAWIDEWTAGYKVDIANLLTTFKDGAENFDQMVTIRGIPVYSHCEHHLAEIVGHATVSYIPDGRIVGLSKINRLVKAFAQRLQVQERITTQIADALMEYLKPQGCGVIISARHLCMESRGINQQGHETITSALRGVFKDEPETRAEFMHFTRSN